MPSTEITNVNINEWFNIANAERTNLANFSALQTGLAVIQLGLYYDAFDDEIDERDAKIDAQLEFMEELNTLTDTQDLPMLRCKKNILTELGLPSVDMCGDALRCASDSTNDGRAVDSKATMLVAETCAGLPQGWGVHEGTLIGAKAGSYIGGIIGNNAKRQQEEFRKNRTDLIRIAQSGMKSVYNANDTLAMYAQAVSIHAGLADIYLQGFNSAGAALGTGLGQLSSSSGVATTTAMSSNNGSAFAFGDADL